jgi:hypothetical protein
LLDAHFERLLILLNDLQLRFQFEQILNVPHGERAALAARGWAGENACASGVFFACGLVGRPF